MSNIWGSWSVPFYSMVNLTLTFASFTKKASSLSKMCYFTPNVIQRKLRHKQSPIGNVVTCYFTVWRSSSPVLLMHCDVDEPVVMLTLQPRMSKRKPLPQFKYLTQSGIKHRPPVGLPQASAPTTEPYEMIPKVEYIWQSLNCSLAVIDNAIWHRIELFSVFK